MGWNNIVREKWDSNLLTDGLISDGVRGAFYGDVSQLWAQLLSACVCAAFAFVFGYIWFKFSDKITPLRVTPEIEMSGLDIPEMGVPGYPDFLQAPHA
jgi:Amt family ammonium transporter